MDSEERPTERDRSPAEPQDERSRSAVRKSWWRSRVREVAVLAGLSLIVVVLVNAFVAQPFLVPSTSMEQTLRVGDRILVNKLAYRFGNEVRRGDIVVFDGT